MIEIKKINTTTFEKVSFETYLDYFRSNRSEEFTDDEVSVIRKIYDRIILPKRSTLYSCGYDFFTPFDFIIPTDNIIVQIPTGIRCKMHSDEWMILLPRSSSIKIGLRLVNTAGVIDADYACSKNEGHILAVIMNNDISAKCVISNFIEKPDGNILPQYTASENSYSSLVKAGEAFCQGIILNYKTAYEDNKEAAIRDGGFGSTTKEVK